MVVVFHVCIIETHRRIGGIVGVIVVGGRAKPCTDWRLSWINVQKYHVVIALLHLVRVLVALCSIRVPIIMSDSDTG